VVVGTVKLYVMGVVENELEHGSVPGQSDVSGGEFGSPSKSTRKRCVYVSPLESFIDIVSPWVTVIAGLEEFHPAV
jgi:hypothetical protein